MVGGSYGAVIVASLVAMLIGWVWYMPGVFGSRWMRLRGVKVQGDMKMPASDLFVEFLSTLVTVFVMYVLIVAFGAFNSRGALQLSLMVWLGFYVTALISEVVWEKKHFGVFLINAGQRLVTLIVIALILALW